MQKYHPAILTQISPSYDGKSSIPAKYFGKNLYAMCSYIKLLWGIEEYSRRVLMKVVSEVQLIQFFFYFNSSRMTVKKNTDINILEI